MQPTLKMQYKTFSISAKTSEKQLNKNQSELSKSESTGITVNIKLLLQMLNPAIMLSVSVESGLSSVSLYRFLLSVCYKPTHPLYLYSSSAAACDLTF